MPLPPAPNCKCMDAVWSVRSLGHSPEFFMHCGGGAGGQCRGWWPLSFSNMAMGRAAGLGGHLAYGFKAFGRILFSRSSSYCNAVASIARRFPIDTVWFLRTRICQLSDTLCNKRARLSSSVISGHLRPSSILPSAKVNGVGTGTKLWG